jgi:hypothetical protein
MSAHDTLPGPPQPRVRSNPPLPCMLPLFDSHHGTMPHPMMLVHLVQVFLSASHATFPAKRERLVPQFNGTLSPLLANSMASLAARYSQSSNMLACGATAMSNTYGDTAKVCPPSLPSLASLLHSDHGFTHNASSMTVLIFHILRFFTLSLTSPSVSHLHVIYLGYLRVTNAIGHIQLAIVCWKDGSFGGLGSAASLGLPYAWTCWFMVRLVEGGKRKRGGWKMRGL